MYIDNHAVLKRALVVIICTSCEKLTMEDPTNTSSGSWGAAIALVAILAVVCAAVWLWSRRVPDPGPAHTVPHTSPTCEMSSNVHYYDQPYAIHIRNYHAVNRHVCIMYTKSGSNVQLRALGLPRVTKDSLNKVLLPNVDRGYIDLGVTIMIFARLGPCDDITLPVKSIRGMTSWSVAGELTPKQKFFLLPAPFATEFEVTIGVAGPDFDEVNFDKSFVNGISEDGSIRFLSKEPSVTIKRGFKFDIVDWTKASKTLGNMLDTYGGWYEADKESESYIPIIPSDLLLLGKEDKAERNCVACQDDIGKPGSWRIAQQHACRQKVFDMIHSESMPFCDFLRELAEAGESVGYCWAYGEYKCKENQPGCGYPFAFTVNGKPEDQGISTVSYNYLKSHGYTAKEFQGPCDLPQDIPNDPGLTCPNCTHTKSDKQDSFPGGGIVVIDMHPIAEITAMTKTDSSQIIQASWKNPAPGEHTPCSIVSCQQKNRGE
jgi:hypothetical protein